jgi:hypothetical protein
MDPFNGILVFNAQPSPYTVSWIITSPAFLIWRRDGRARGERMDCEDHGRAGNELIFET